MTSSVFEIEDKMAHERPLLFEVSDMLHFEAISVITIQGGT